MVKSIIKSKVEIDIHHWFICYLRYISAKHNGNCLTTSLNGMQSSEGTTFLWWNNHSHRLSFLFLLCWRYKNKIFIVWHGGQSLPSKKFRQFKLQLKLTGVDIKYRTALTATWFDIILSQHNGSIKTKLHGPMFIQPFESAYYVELSANERFQRLIYPILRYTLFRCSEVQDFYQQYMCLFTCCIYNRFPLDSIQGYLHQFFKRMNPMKNDYIYDQHSYNTMRQQQLATISPTPLKRKHNDEEVPSKKIKLFWF
jgi:hypothetical protein